MWFKQRREASEFSKLTIFHSCRDMEPDSAIVNLYDVEDCIPPHIDHHDFSRPFCTISLLSQEEIMFGRRLVPDGPGEFRGDNYNETLIPLPVGKTCSFFRNLKFSPRLTDHSPTSRWECWYRLFSPHSEWEQISHSFIDKATKHFVIHTCNWRHSDMRAARLSVSHPYMQLKALRYEGS